MDPQPIERRGRRGPGPRLALAGAMHGERVVAASGEALATIKDILVDAGRGRIAYAVLGVGGFMGRGERLIAVPWNALQLDAARNRFVLLAEPSALERAPDFDQQSLPAYADLAWHSALHAHWRVRPYWD